MNDNLIFKDIFLSLKVASKQHASYSVKRFRKLCVLEVRSGAEIGG